MKKHLFMLCAWVTLVLGVAIEERLMETPMENTVTDFELAEDGLSVVLTNAIEDQRAVVEDLVKKHDSLSSARLLYQSVGGMDGEAEELAPKVAAAAEMQFRAMRVLGLLEATREREAGQVT